MSTAPRPKTRLEGLDFARFLAFVGMVLVNFHIVMGDESGAAWADAFLHIFEGKAAATFVMLAGIGLGFATKPGRKNYIPVILRRAAFLFAIGLLNSLIFPADILHYYAVYFVIALLFVRSSTQVLIGTAVSLPFIFVAMLFVFNYDAGWDWSTLTYSGFFEYPGFVRNLFFNGWHPVIPWMSFFFVGLALSRLDLGSAKIQTKILGTGTAALILAYAYSGLIGPTLGEEMKDLVSLLPVPPMPQYVLAGTGAGLFVIGGSLVLFRTERMKILQPLVLTGRQTLTLYILHIFVGMGVLEAFGLIGGQPSENAILASFIFAGLSVGYVSAWQIIFKTGPIEWLMRRLAG
ncbi:MAG: DUF1624 domain-containing protein [Parvibaculaceae bacterium]|nr:DUF1624 domain-containing protein [Parvibaculaceae bacterium]